MHPTTHLAFNRKSGLWEIHWTTRDEHGRPRRHQHRTNHADQAAAEAYRAKWLKTWTEATEGLNAPTVGEIIERYLEDCTERGVRRSQWHVLAAPRKALGAFRPGDLQGDPLNDYRRARTRLVTPGTVVRELGALVAALHWAAHPGKGGLIEARDVPQIIRPRVPHQERQFLDEVAEAEFHRLALAWRRKRVGLYVAIGLGTGARKEAIEDLHWNRVDLKAGVVDFRAPGDRLTNKRRVPTPINDRLRDVLERVPASERWGRVIGNGNVRGGYDTFRASTPWPWVSSHILRHTFITLSLRAGVTIWEVAQMVGDTPEIISKHYGHHLADWRLHEAANKRFRSAT